MATCTEPGCGRTLSTNNVTGKCQTHGGSSHRAAPAVHGTCSTPGCDAKLAHNNSTGKCRVHGGDEGDAQRARCRTPAAHRSPARDRNGLATNGHVNVNRHASGNGHDLVIEKRVSLVLTKIPLEEKLAFISRWLSGEA